jgi:hypothetical protein
LCLDSHGTPVVVEIKRDLSPREAVAQALDYASWLNSATEEQIYDFAEEFLKRPLDEAFFEHFHIEVPSLNCQDHRILLVSSRLDSSAERIVNYLSERHSLDINAVFFNYAKLSNGKEILVRSVLVDEARQPLPKSGRRPKLNDLIRFGEEKKTATLIEICRRVNSMWKEERATSFGGSYRYWVQPSAGKWKMVFGINAAGERKEPPIGELDVWIPTKSLSVVTGVNEPEIRTRLSADHPLLEAQPVDCIIRLKQSSHAERLVDQLMRWSSSASARTASTP